jgi:hypothetical protein
MLGGGRIGTTQFLAPMDCYKIENSTKKQNPKKSPFRKLTHTNMYVYAEEGGGPIILLAATINLTNRMKIMLTLAFYSLLVRGMRPGISSSEELCWNWVALACIEDEKSGVFNKFRR